MPIRKKIIIANKNLKKDESLSSLEDNFVAPDHVQPFILDISRLRGRIVRLPTVVNDILAAHDYPDRIAELLAEAMCLTTLLAGMLKFEGIFTLQIKGDSVVKMLVCDMTNAGVLRGTATFNKELLADAGHFSFKQMMGNGYLSFTVDQAQSQDRTQGIVPLEGETLTQCVHNYFQQSEQIDTSFVSAVEKMPDGTWNAGALMLQNIGQSGIYQNDDWLHGLESWQTALTFMHSVTEQELLQKDLSLKKLLYRLFNEEGIRIFEPLVITKGCRCNMDKIKAILDNLAVEERQEYSVNGVITVTCEFCNTLYNFPLEEFLS
jgi:molecular chaperone Hsp33